MFVWALNTPLYLKLHTYQKMCTSTKKMVAGLAHEKYFKKQQIGKKMYKQKTINILTTYLIRLTYQIRSDK